VFSGKLLFLPYLEGKLQVDSDFPIQKANYLLKDKMEWLSLLSFASVEYQFNTTIEMIFTFI
jgi:hypothetical protein